MRSRMCCSGRRWHKHGIGGSWAGSRLVFPRLSHLGRHLERARPRLYAAIGKHAGHSPPSSTVANLDPADIVYGIGVELFKNNISWGKVTNVSNNYVFTIKCEKVSNTSLNLGCIVDGGLWSVGQQCSS